MAQLIYAVSALAVIMFFSIAIQRAGINGEQEMYITEARSRMLGVAQETVERIARMDMAFDAATDPDRVDPGLTFPFVNSPADLTSAGAFTPCDYAAGSCLDIDDFHGVSVTDSADGLPVTLDFEVVYVDTLTGAESGSATFAKMLTLEVSTTALRLNDAPLAVRYSRVFVYPSPMDFARGVASRL